MSWCIYKHTNKVNGKVYIGQTCQKPEDRWQNGRGYQHNPLFYNAIQKYGWNGFTHEIIETEIQTQEEANQKEIDYIAQYNSYEEGYNLTKGGNNAEHRGKGVCQIDMASFKVVAIYPTLRHAERAMDGDHTLIQRVCERSQTNGRHNITAYGYYWCYEEDYSDDWRPLTRRENHTSGEEVYQLQKEGTKFYIVEIYPSILEASRKTNTPHGNIWQCCNNGDYITAKGFYWCYVRNYSPSWRPRKDKNKARQRIMRCKNTGDIFFKSQEAARFAGLKGPESIYRACLDSNKTAGKHPITGERLKWEYIEEGEGLMNTLCWYGRRITDADVKNLNSGVGTVYVDEQNLDLCKPILLAEGLVVAEEGYELTGINDLYQYKFIRR